MKVQARLADYLRRERKELKHVVIAEKAGIKQSRFSELMNCKREMRADELVAICRALEISPNTFMNQKQ